MKNNLAFLHASSAFRLLVAITATLLTSSASAASILTDGGFENAGASMVYFAGSSIDNGSWVVNTGSVYIDSADPYVYAGGNSLNLTLANLYVPNTLSQTLSTVAGQSYSVDFFADADSANSFSLTENGLALTGLPSSIVQNGFPHATNSALFLEYSGMFTASSANTLLSFTATGDPAIGSPFGSVMIDNVAVQPVASTPEPGSFALVLTGMLGVGKALRMRSRARSAQTA